MTKCLCGGILKIIKGEGTVKNLKKQWIALSVVLVIITAIYFPFYITMLTANSTVVKTKIIATMVFVGLIAGIALSIFKANKSNVQPTNNNESNSNEVGKSSLLSSIIGVGIALILLFGLIIFFFMSISE